MSQQTILIVEDDDTLRDALADILQVAGYQIREACNGRAALAILKECDIAMIISDVQMDVMDGITLLQQIKQQQKNTPFVLMTAYGSIETAVEAMRLGAQDYLVKPFEAEVLVNMVSRYVPHSQETDVELIAHDENTLAVYKLVQKVANSDATVLFTGESGAGKEVFARALHRNSPRGDGPFIAINCAAIPENMLEAMLFGYEKGAFTGAYKSSAGKFEQANGGTILLDEISEMDLGLQAKLLRVLQEREVERLGGNAVIPLDVRVLATTNRDMKKEVVGGRFREDLYYRLNVFPIHLPPLRERKQDILALMRYLLQRANKHNSEPVPEIDASAVALLENYHWPGNVRELDNVTQRALILQTKGIILPEHILFEPEQSSTGSFVSQSIMEKEPSNSSAVLAEGLKNKEYVIIKETLKQVNGSRKEAAKRLGISQRTLRYKLAKMRDSGMDVPAAYSLEV
ncbi:MAG: sigma-54 dependent transcriptional regulator [Gammaproteobacteria bacterium]|nr:sigma-54 dependent transcriptional regulator [Gammaproteobacteria bacterium]MDH5728330.1 sigma-54 dependent transcriptional regulator [Gammaproteobacteria bacterium]